MQITRENASTELIKFISLSGKNQIEIAKGAGVSKNAVSGIVARGTKPDSLTVYNLNRYMEEFPEIGKVD